LATKVDNSEDCASDVSDNLNGSVEACQIDMSDKNTVLVNATNNVGIEPENAKTANKDSTVDIESLISSVTATVNSIRGKINNLLDSTGHVSPNRSVCISPQICIVYLFFFSEYCTICLGSLGLSQLSLCTEGEFGAKGSLAR
jgi:hypothetical protein